MNALALFSFVLLSVGNCFLPCVLDIKLFRAGLPSCPALVGHRMTPELSRCGGVIQITLNKLVETMV